MHLSSLLQVLHVPLAALLPRQPWPPHAAEAPCREGRQRGEEPRWERRRRRCASSFSRCCSWAFVPQEAFRLAPNMLPWPLASPFVDLDLRISL